MIRRRSAGMNCENKMTSLADKIDFCFVFYFYYINGNLKPDFSLFIRTASSG